MTRYIIIAVNILVIILNSNIVMAYGVSFHSYYIEGISKKDYEFFNLNKYLIGNLGFEKGADSQIGPREIYKWMSLGGIREDDPYPLLGMFNTRPSNHFHNPLVTDLNKAGFTGIWGTGIINGDSALLFAQKDVGTQSPGGYYSWKDARLYYFNALTATDDTSRETNFADTFRALGQVMHLVQDMSVPEHARNDGHYRVARTLETWTEEALNKDKFPQRRVILDAALINPINFDITELSQTIPADPFSEASVPIARLFDSEQYNGYNPAVTIEANVGLAEYTNANFVSGDTAFSSGLRYPSRTTSVEQRDLVIPDPFVAGQTVNRAYYFKVADGETGKDGNGYCLAGVDYLSFFRRWNPETGQDDLQILPLMDDHVFEDYAELLLPRAVGYSMALVHYFFRGDIEITLPAHGTYAIAKPDSDFKDLRINAKNITTTGEEMSGGEIQLVVRYKRALEDPFQSRPVPISDEFTYVVVPEANAIRAIPRDASVELAFDLTAKPIPLWATDVYLQIVYRGVLGGENEAVVTGFKDISEPTPLSVINSMDYICLGNLLMLAGSDDAVNALDADGTRISAYGDVFSHELNNGYVAFSTDPPPIDLAAKYSAKLLRVPSGYYASIFVLTESERTGPEMNYKGTITPQDDRDVWPIESISTVLPFPGLKNQTDQENGIAIQTYPIMETFRGTYFWSGINWTNRSYSSGTSCDDGSFTQVDLNQVSADQLEIARQ